MNQKTGYTRRLRRFGAVLARAKAPLLRRTQRAQSGSDVQVGGRSAGCGREPAGRCVVRARGRAGRSKLAGCRQYNTERGGGCRVLVTEKMLAHHTGVCPVGVIVITRGSQCDCSRCISIVVTGIAHGYRLEAGFCKVGQLVRPRKHRCAAQGQPQQPYETVNPGATHGRQ